MHWRRFQSTRPRGARRRESCRDCASIRHFNPRARVGRDLFRFQIADAVAISIHAPAWGATPKYALALHNFSISIHAPAWGATKNYRIVMHVHDISIHAPAWGATRAGARSYGHRRISIHAPAWGATRCAGRFQSLKRFQSTRPRGARRQGKAHVRRVLISIHAPAWGATQRKSFPNQPPQFQSTRPRGARRRNMRCPQPDPYFNPRARVGRDLPSASLAPSPSHFNPRARVGRDVLVHDAPSSSLISIHAPAWGATPCMCCQYFP